MFRINQINAIVLLCALLLIGAHRPANAQDLYPLDPAMPMVDFNPGSEITVLNASMGGRFSLTLNAAQNGIFTGVLGFDQDEYRQMLLAVEENGKLYCFNTANPPQGAEYLKNQTVTLAMNATVIKGQTPAGTQAVVEIINPFTPSNTLADTAQIKLSACPAHFIKVHLTAPKGQALTGKFVAGFNMVPFDRNKQVMYRWWNNGQVRNKLYFRDVAGPEAMRVFYTPSKTTRKGVIGPYHTLAEELKAEAGQSQTIKFVYAGYFGGNVVTDLKHNVKNYYYYTKLWNNIDEVLDYAINNFDANVATAARFEKVLSRSGASPEEKWVTALSFHTDLANAVFLIDDHGTPGYYLLEGRFLHLSTIDVAHETEVAAVFCPWRLKLQIQRWSNHVALREIYVPSSRSVTGVTNNLEGVSAAELGPFLFHDVGDYPFLSTGEDYSFGPMMPVEENATFTLLVYWYWKLTNDNDYVKQQLGFIDVLLQSLINRDSDNSGLADYGMGWSTYDVSEAIKRSPENVYLGVKQLSAYLAAAEMLETLPQIATNSKTAEFKVTDFDGAKTGGDKKALFEKSIIDNRYLRKRQAAKYISEAEKIVSSLKKAYKKYGYIPVSLDSDFEGWAQKSIVMPEGLFYAGLAGLKHPIINKAIPMFKDSYKQALQASTKSYGVRLSDKEDVTWFSKVMVSDIVASYWFNMNESTAHYTYNWNKNNPQAYQDGAHSPTEPWPGNWYPRGISSLGYLFRDFDFTANKRKEFLEDIK